MKKYLLLIIGFCTLQLTAQSAEKTLVSGNKDYNNRKYSQAESKYRIASSKEAKNSAPAYNKANAIYRQYQTNESITAYQQALKVATTKEEKHKISHNLGNALMNKKDYAGAVEAYKNALRNNPKDDETRYNFALAKQLLKNNQNQDNKDNKDQKDKDNKDNENKENKDQKDKDNKENKNQDNKDQDQENNPKDKREDSKKDKGDKDPQQQKQEQSKQQMENMLNALDNHEKQVRERIQNRDKEGKPVKSSSTKDW